MEKVSDIDNFRKGYLEKIFMIFLLYAFFILSGLFEEKYTKTDYIVMDNEGNEQLIKFKFPSISIVTISILSLIISSFMIHRGKKAIKNKEVNPISLNDRIVLGIIYIVSKYSGQTSLLFLDYIVKTIGKSCKSACIMFLNFLNSYGCINKKFKQVLNLKGQDQIKSDKNKSTFHNLFKVLLTTSSVLLFNFGSSKPSSVKNANNESTSSVFGLVLLITSLFSDGLISIKEKSINNFIKNNDRLKEYENIIPYEYMFIFSSISLIFCTLEIIYGCIFGSYLMYFNLMLENTDIVINLILYSIFDCLGELVIFMFLNKYGPLSLSMITGVRKILTVTLSIIYFGKHITLAQQISLILATTVIFLEIFENSHNNNNNTSKDIKKLEDSFEMKELIKVKIEKKPTK